MCFFFKIKTFIKSNKITSEVIFQQSCAKVCKPDNVLDTKTNITIETRCCALNNCNYFDFNMPTTLPTTTRNPSANLTCYKGVGPNLSGIPTNNEISLCIPPANNFCFVKYLLKNNILNFLFKIFI